MSVSLNTQTPCYGLAKEQLRIPEDEIKRIFWWDNEEAAPFCPSHEYRQYSQKDFRFDVTGSTTLYDL